MTANSDNAMARFLFAILRQKCLKDIDWNKVASDPVLLQPITNGHAARMRYSRFRSSMLGIEPQRRNRTAGNSSRVTKSKKDKDAKLDKAPKAKSGDSLNDAPETQDEGAADSIPSRSSSVKVKHEISPLVLESQVTACSPPATTTGPFPDNRVQFQNRLMTPCSDTDVIMAPQNYAGSPVSDVLHPEPFDFPAPGHCGNSNDHGSWHHHSPTYATFGVAYELDNYSVNFSEHPSPQDQHRPYHHQHHQHEQSQGLCVPSAVMDPDHNHASVKQETWDSQYHAI
ncbi:hypothetical protein MAPG_00708 [Magnaporthiopsis poae ATCC 64411]|uniref:Myb-like DNA-binding domain-containing protein n=1 Tax=Magnaporthiopsis poae (strain ATCC 64411 / 73-15) TaxID=644358 RepID=A0A0C4DLR3_MAGP6|nr:hypothetical protein MAPG_00708 [Magnaporthiopsis poae ATCC 64411]